MGPKRHRRVDHGPAGTIKRHPVWRYPRTNAPSRGRSGGCSRQISTSVASWSDVFPVAVPLRTSTDRGPAPTGKAYKRGELKLRGELSGMESPEAFERWLDPVPRHPLGDSLSGHLGLPRGGLRSGGHAPHCPIPGPLREPHRHQQPPSAGDRAGQGPAALQGLSRRESVEGRSHRRGEIHSPLSAAPLAAADAAHPAVRFHGRLAPEKRAQRGIVRTPSAPPDAARAQLPESLKPETEAELLPSTTHW